MKPYLTDSVRVRIKGTSLENISPTQTVAELLRRQDSTYHDLLHALELDGVEEREVSEEVEVQVKYDGYIRRQLQQIEKFKKLEKKSIPSGFNYNAVTGFSREVREKLQKIRPETVGQASRISGITPAAISLLLVALEKGNHSSPRAANS
jgi:tRNA uridine 5-carboxymethylaminomethyl modification enzyme